MKFFSRKFANLVGCKLIETFISVKVWIILFVFYVDLRLIDIAIKFQAWEVLGHIVTLTTAVVGSAVIMREGFKISALKNGNSTPEQKENMIP